MTSHKCYDCGKTIEPDRELRFFELRLLADEETYAPTEGYLCEACTAQRNLVVTDKGEIIKKSAPIRKGFFQRLFGGSQSQEGK